MSLMKRVKKSILLVFVLVLVTFVFTSCNKITKNNYDKIYIGMQKKL